jgi:hypothetical protein
MQHIGTAGYLQRLLVKDWRAIVGNIVGLLGMQTVKS